MAEEILEQHEPAIIRKLLASTDLKVLFWTWSTLRAYCSGRPVAQANVTVEHGLTERTLLALWQSGQAERDRPPQAIEAHAEPYLLDSGAQEPENREEPDE